MFLGKVFKRVVPQVRVKLFTLCSCEISSESKPFNPLLPFHKDGDWDKEIKVFTPTMLVMNQTLCVACLAERSQGDISGRSQP